MAYIEPRKTKDGKTRFRVLIRLKGSRPVSETFPNKTKARKWAERTEAEISDGRYFKTAEAKKHTLKELIDRYEKDHQKKIISAKQKPELGWWKKSLGHSLLSELSPALIGEFRDTLASEMTPRRKIRSDGSVQRYLALLSHVFSTAIKEYGWMEENPMVKVRKPKVARGRVRFLSDTERVLLLSACKQSSNPSLFPVVTLALSSGMRLGEIMNLRWANVDLKSGRILLEKTKNGERRTVPLVGQALELFSGLEKKRRIDSTLVFPSKDNPQKPVDLRFPWEKAIQISGIQDFRFHDLRHSCASYLAMNGANLVEIAEILGHKQISVTKKYSHLTESHRAKTLESMNERFLGSI